MKAPPRIADAARKRVQAALKDIQHSVAVIKDGRPGDAETDASRREQVYQARTGVPLAEARRMVARPGEGNGAALRQDGRLCRRRVLRARHAGGARGRAHHHQGRPRFWHRIPDLAAAADHQQPRDRDQGRAARRARRIRLCARHFRLAAAGDALQPRTRAVLPDQRRGRARLHRGGTGRTRQRREGPRRNSALFRSATRATSISSATS